MAERPTTDPADPTLFLDAAFSARAYVIAYRESIADGFPHHVAVAAAYTEAIRDYCTKPDGLTVTFRDSDATITNSDGTVPNL